MCKNEFISLSLPFRKADWRCPSVFQLESSMHCTFINVYVHQELRKIDASHLDAYSCSFMESIKFQANYWLTITSYYCRILSDIPRPHPPCRFTNVFCFIFIPDLKSGLCFYSHRCALSCWVFPAFSGVFLHISTFLFFLWKNREQTWWTRGLFIEGYYCYTPWSTFSFNYITRLLWCSLTLGIWYPFDEV